jgi:hypothetical protein
MRIRNLGHYGSDVRRIEDSRPDLIFDLFMAFTGVNLANYVSDGRTDLGALERVAPTRLLDIEPGAVPGFTAWRARALGQRADLSRCWRAGRRGLACCAPISRALRSRPCLLGRRALQSDAAASGAGAHIGWARPRSRARIVQWVRRLLRG